VVKRQVNSAVAQSVEQRTENPCVAGSIPAHTTKRSRILSGFFRSTHWFFDPEKVSMQHSQCRIHFIWTLAMLEICEQGRSKINQ
jgi:hypothetical protein